MSQPEHFEPNVGPDDPKHDWLLSWAINFLDLFQVLVAILAFISMMGCVAVAFVEIARGFFLTANLRPFTVATAAPLISWTLSGLELFFLAPLPYLAFLSVVKLVRATIEFERDKDRRILDEAHELVGRVKHLIIGLMIAVAATEIIHREIGGYGTPLDLQTVAAMLGLILVLTIYYWVARPKG